MVKVAALKEFYAESPVWLRSVFGLLPPAYAMLPSFWLELRRLRRHRLLSDGDRREHARRLLVDSLSYAKKKSPFYREKLAAVDDCEIQEDPYGVLRSVPTVDKVTIAEEPERFIVPGVAGYIATTGGTTGRPVAIRLSNRSWITEWAFVFDYLATAGVNPWQRRLGLRGVRFSSGVRDSSPVEVNPTYRELRVSPFHLVKVHKQQIARAIAEYRPRYIHGYPSAIQELLLLLGDEAGSVLEDIRCVLTVSEDMPDNFEKMVRDTLGCRVLSFYGMTERVSFIEKSASGKWIPNSCYGYTEILDGEIVGTGFTNCAMPLLRYRTGDYVDVNSEGEIVGIRGRWSHASLIGAQGNAISMTALNVHSENAARVGPIQFVQKEKGRVEVCALESADASALKQLVLEYESKVGQGLVFIPRIVGEFKKSPVGKGILVVSELNRVSR